MRIDCVVFDLDGTLVSSHETIYKTTCKALGILNISGDLHEQKFYNMIGHHFVDIFRDLDVDVADFEEFIEIYKAHYFDFIDSSYLYDYASEVLEELKKKNIKTGLLTTKGQDQAEKIVEHFQLSKYIDYVMGRRNGIAHKPSAEPLEIIMNELGVDKENALMVGDSELDIQCGKNANTKTCAVTFGYRSKENILKENPDFIIDSMDQLLKLV